MAKKRIRIYDFGLPFVASGWKLWAGMQVFRQSEFWPKMPAEVRSRAETAANTFGGELIITQQDLDSLPDDVWGQMANKFDLAYHYETIEVADAPAKVSAAAAPKV